MRAAAASTLRRLHAVQAERPGEPCVILVGPQKSREQVWIALGGQRSSGAKAEELRGEAVPGLVLINPPQVLQAVEATELATFLRGLHAASSILVAHACGNGSQEEEEPQCDGHTSETTFTLLTQFYNPKSWHLFCSVALVGSHTTDPEIVTPHVKDACRQYRMSNLCSVNTATGPLPQAYCIDDVEQVRQLVADCRSADAVMCDPLPAPSVIMSQYRAIQQQLSQQRPSSRGSRVSKFSRASGSPSQGPPPLPEGSALPSHAPRSPESQAGQVSPDLDPPGKPLSKWTVMVFGKTGAGKSHLANLLVGHRAFESGDSLASVTNEKSVRTAKSKDGALTILDTIGFGDTRLPPETVIHSLRDTALEAPDGIDLLLFVMKKERVSAVEQEILSYVTQLLFGPACLPNLYMVVTHAGRLAKEADSRAPWLREQADASPQFASMLAMLGPEPVKRIAFVENSDPKEAEDEEDRSLASRRQQRALADVHQLLRRHRAAPYQHGIMVRAGQLHSAHLEELKREVRERLQEEIKHELDRDRGALEADRKKFQDEVEFQREKMRLQEEELQRRCESEWGKMRDEFEQRARDLAKDDLEPLAKDIVEKTEKKAGGRRCVVM